MRPSPLPPSGRLSRRVLGMMSALLLFAATPAAARSSAPSASGVAEDDVDVDVDDDQEETIADLVKAAEETALRASSSDDPQDRALAAFHGYQLWLRAYAVDGSPSHLCAARGLLTDLLADDAVDIAIRDDAEARVTELDQMLSELGELSCDLEEAQAQEPAAQPSEAGILLPARAPRTNAATDSPPQSVDGPSPSPRARRLRIVGGVSLGLGASLLAAMTYGIVVDARTAAQLQEYALKKDAGDFSEADWSKSQQLGETGRAGARLAAFAGIGGSVAIVSGAVLLLAGRQENRRRHALALSPALGAGHAQIILRGRF